MSDPRPPAVIVTGVGGDAAQGIVKGLRQSALIPWVIGLDLPGVQSPGFLLCDQAVSAPPFADPEYVPTLLRLVTDSNAKVLMLGIDGEIGILAPHRAAFEALGCRVAISGPELIRVANDKVETSRWFLAHGLPAPRTFVPGETDADSILEQLGLPVIVKPRAGNGSRDVRLIHAADEVRQIAHHGDERLCIQEYIDGPEYTCSLLFDDDSELRDWMTTLRDLKQGRTVRARVCDVPEIDELIREFAEAIGDAVGSINLQLRMAGDVPNVFEINPRFSGSTALRVALGYNEPARLWEYFVSGTPMQRQTPQRATAYRVWEEVVVPDEP